MLVYLHSYNDDEALFPPCVFLFWNEFPSSTSSNTSFRDERITVFLEPQATGLKFAS